MARHVTLRDLVFIALMAVTLAMVAADQKESTQSTKATGKKERLAVKVKHPNYQPHVTHSAPYVLTRNTISCLTEQHAQANGRIPVDRSLDGRMKQFSRHWQIFKREFSSFLASTIFSPDPWKQFISCFFFGMFTVASLLWIFASNGIASFTKGSVGGVKTLLRKRVSGIHALSLTHPSSLPPTLLPFLPFSSLSLSSGCNFYIHKYAHHTRKNRNLHRRKDFPNRKALGNKLKYQVYSKADLQQIAK
jgi:hypothetical protein